MGRYLVSESQGWKFVFQWDEHSTQSGVFRPQRTEDIRDLSLLSSSSLSYLVLLRKSIHGGSWVWQTCNYLQVLFCEKIRNKNDEDIYANYCKTLLNLETSSNFRSLVWRTNLWVSVEVWHDSLLMNYTKNKGDCIFWLSSFQSFQSLI